MKSEFQTVWYSNISIQIPCILKYAYCKVDLDFCSFDTTDDDEDVRKDDPAPLIPTPVGFTPDCSVLDNASILFLNTNILLELRKEWRFLYSTRTHSRSFSDLIDAIEFQGKRQQI